MAAADAKKVLAFALVHRSFRQALRSNPFDALDRFQSQLKLGAHPSVDELDALVSLTDEEYSALEKISTGLGDSVAGEHEITGGVLL
jgi:hypothetical protein